MIKVSVMYSSGQGHTFDMGYYTGKHIAMVKQKLGATLKGVAVEQGIAGGEPGAPPAFLAFGHLYFDTVEAFQAAFGPHASEILNDIPNFTNIKPLIQISEVKI